MLDLRGGVLHFDVWEGVRSATVAEQERVALRIVACIIGAGIDFDQSSVGVLTVSSRDALADNGAARILSKMDHLGACVGLLLVVGERYGIELADGVVALQDDARVLPGDGRTGLNLGPRDLGILGALASLGDEVVDAAYAIFPGYQFCTVEYLMVAPGRAMSSTTAA